MLLLIWCSVYLPFYGPRLMLSRRAVNINCFAEVTLLLFSTALREWELCFTEDRSRKGPSTTSLFYRHGAEPQGEEVVCQGQEEPR